MTDEPKHLGKCIRCDKPIVSLEPAMPANPNGAMMGAVAGHYGSIHDLSTATVFVCDECVIVAGLELATMAQISGEIYMPKNIGYLPHTAW